MLEACEPRRTRHGIEVAQWLGVKAALAIAILTVPARASSSAVAPPIDTRQTLHLTFGTEPRWAAGFELKPTSVRSLGDPRLVLSAGLLGGLEFARSESHQKLSLEPGWSSLPHEEEAYPNEDAIKSYRIDPFSIDDGDLLITASPMPARVAAGLLGDMSRTFLSGALNTYPFYQLYGYFEVSA